MQGSFHSVRFNAAVFTILPSIRIIDWYVKTISIAYLTHGLLGLPTIRTYGEIPRFLKENAYYIDLENRALILTVTNQRWLAIRLDFCGAILVLSVSRVDEKVVLILFTMLLSLHCLWLLGSLVLVPLKSGLYSVIQVFSFMLYYYSQ